MPGEKSDPTSADKEDEKETLDRQFYDEYFYKQPQTLVLLITTLEHWHNDRLAREDRALGFPDGFAGLAPNARRNKLITFNIMNLKKFRVQVLRINDDDFTDDEQLLGEWLKKWGGLRGLVKEELPKISPVLALLAYASAVFEQGAIRTNLSKGSLATGHARLLARLLFRNKLLIDLNDERTNFIACTLRRKKSSQSYLIAILKRHHWWSTIEWSKKAGKTLIQRQPINKNRYYWLVHLCRRIIDTHVTNPLHFTIEHYDKHDKRIVTYNHTYDEAYEHSRRYRHLNRDRPSVGRPRTRTPSPIHRHLWHPDQELGPPPAVGFDRTLPSRKDLVPPNRRTSRKFSSDQEKTMAQIREKRSSYYRRSRRRSSSDSSSEFASMNKLFDESRSWPIKSLDDTDEKILPKIEGTYTEASSHHLVTESKFYNSVTKPVMIKQEPILVDLLSSDEEEKYFDKSEYYVPCSSDNNLPIIKNSITSPFNKAMVASRKRPGTPHETVSKKPFVEIPHDSLVTVNSNFEDNWHANQNQIHHGTTYTLITQEDRPESRMSSESIEIICEIEYRNPEITDREEPAHLRPTTFDPNEPIHEPQVPIEIEGQDQINSVQPENSFYMNFHPELNQQQQFLVEEAIQTLQMPQMPDMQDSNNAEVLRLIQKIIELTERKGSNPPPNFPG